MNIRFTFIRTAKRTNMAIVGIIGFLGGVYALKPAVVEVANIIAAARAIKTFGDSHLAHPGSPWPYFEVAKTLAETGHKDLAIKAYKQFVDNSRVRANSPYCLEAEQCLANLGYHYKKCRTPRTAMLTGSRGALGASEK